MRSPSMLPLDNFDVKPYNEMVMGFSFLRVNSICRAEPSTDLGMSCYQQLIPILF